MAQNSPQSNKNTNLSEQAVREFIDLQREELKLRQQDLALRQQELQHNYDLSKEGLKQQGDYLKSAPKYAIQNRLLLAGFFILVLAIVAGVLLYCVHLGKEEIALRILEIVATAIISAGGGYAWGKSRGQQEEKSKVEMVD